MNTDKLNTRVLNKTENSFELEVVFPMDCGFFDGHFPELPLLPGVVQTHLAIRFSEVHLEKKTVFAGFKSIKFFTPIFPDSKVILQCQYEPTKKQLGFQYSGNGHVYSKGVVVMKDV
ncbi:(3R)-hydroxymyristoyl-ACP dehydratase [compost metagenome]